MNTVLSTHVDEQHHQRPPSLPRESSQRRVTLPDRVALHLGLALITWSRRPRTASQVREHNPQARREREQFLRQRDRQWQVAMHIRQPWR